ncbi:hypothetical protein SAMN05661091_0880 [Paenibacillus uliginis N3/975]|uniref:Uncharacterized protein n=1 Tax=Paenibacillus uliginis N3/975 TaxID=1313296 RepID=A0A1X7GP60_9BACL|nr:hypothetical protein [Paenibacillus uliginis]SMF72526.1 hypothetical protein SAMN05661091_0880 [Paenibacillus uliginis N3/975]
MAEVVVKYIHRVYATVIIDGGRTYNSVMERDKPSVEIALEEKGYNVDEAGDIHPIETV